MVRTKHRLNCFCSRRPLLAMYGVDDKGRPYVHIKIYKQRRIYADLIAFGGEVVMCCRECFRWHRIVFRNSSDGKADLSEMPAPPIEVQQQEDVNDRASVG